MDMQNACKDAAEKFAVLDLNWWTCLPEEVIGPDPPGDAEHPPPPEANPLDRQRLGEGEPVKL
jgi:hypothetical protein